MQLQLKESSLLKQQNYIDGQWVAADNGAVLEVHNPANGDVVATVPNAGAAETRRAIEAAKRSFPAWRARTAEDRGRILRRWFELMMSHQEDLARVMTSEQGKPLSESRGEIAYAASFIEWFAEEARRIYGDTIPSPWPDARIVVTREPVGVCAAITPWNFPAAMITRKVAPALAAGCTIIVKPAIADSAFGAGDGGAGRARGRSGRVCSAW
jgi:succinate-semialdehyde dehydrogenase/glutarate-semialdehyde dehydrogenase